MRTAALAILLLALSACAAPLTHKVTASPELPPASPSPSAIPTAPLAVSSVSFHGGEVGVAYAPVALLATGGLSPYKWSVSSGALPGGLAIGNDGSVAGTPTTAGTFSFTIQVTDGASTASLPAASMAIAPAVTFGLIGSCAQYCRVELGCTNACGNFGQVTGGAGPFTYSLAGGQLPSGTSLSGLSLNGTFKGQSGWLQFTVQVTDAFGGTASVSPKFWMYDHVSLSDGKCYSSFYKTTPCSASLAFSGGIPGTQFSVNVASASGQLCTQQVTGAISCGPSSSPPPGFTATVGGGVVNINVPASPNYYFTYNGTVTLALTDQDPCSQGAKCGAAGTVQIQIGAG